jgi:uncharacterized protein YutE (UPF0331/DUF86 family)
MADLAGFRNVLTHTYWKLNLVQVHGILQQDLDTLRQFVEAVTKRVNR